jgi:hypothetical protein
MILECGDRSRRWAKRIFVGGELDDVVGLFPDKLGRLVCRKMSNPLFVMHNVPT